MRQSFKEIAAALIHWRHRHLRRKVTKALENAYQIGLDDAACHLEAAAHEIRQLSKAVSPPQARPLTDFSGYTQAPH
jgi:hypothetical protein